MENSSPDVQALVTRINGERNEKYREVAQKTGSALSVVEKLAAEKALGHSPTGTYIEKVGGGWQKK